MRKAIQITPDYCVTIPLLENKLRVILPSKFIATKLVESAIASASKLLSFS